jgi:uncharacterized SAM-binding protein YcdF (DUF218 family)
MSFYLSKIIWFLFNPFNLILILLFFGLLLNLIPLKLFSKICYLFSFLLFFITGILPIGSFLNYNLEKDFFYTASYPEHIDGILILGGATNPFLSNEHNQINFNDSSERLIESIFLIKRFPDAKVIFSGGSGSISEPNLTHAFVAKKFFQNMDIDHKKIIYEDKSRNTYENILFSKRIARPHSAEKWLLVTSAFHLKRSLAISEKLKWTFIPFATDFNKSKKFKWRLSINFLSNINEFNKASHEWMGLISYYLMGRSSSIFK